MKYELVQGDLAQPIAMALDGVGSIAGATVSFVMAQADGSKRVSRAAVIDDPVLRTVHYQPQAGDTDTPGVYRAQVTLLFPGALPETFPSDEDLWIIIRPRL